MNIKSIRVLLCKQQGATSEGELAKATKADLEVKLLTMPLSQMSRRPVP